MSEDKSIYLKPHPTYEGMYYFRRSKRGRWSKDFYNITRASYYSIGDVVEVKQVGKLPHGTY